MILIIITKYFIIKVATKVSNRRDRSLRNYLSRDKDKDNYLVSSYYYIRSSRIRGTDDKSTITKTKLLNIIKKFNIVLIIIYSNVIVTKLLNKVENNI